MAADILSGRSDAEFLTKIDDARKELRTLLNEANIRVTQIGAIDPESGIDFYGNVAKFEKRLIELALEITGGRQNKAAKLLRMRESTLSMKIRKFKVRRGLK